MLREAPIFQFNHERALLVAQTVDRVCAQTRDPLHALNDAAYWEIRRLESSRRKRDQEELAEWRGLARRLAKLSEFERRQHLRDLVTRYADDIAGNFDRRVFRASTRILPSLVTGLLSPGALPHHLRHPRELLSLDALADKVIIQGDTAGLARLAEKGTLIFVPTHSSNMDSIVFGFALERAGLPPATYGAGKNLFTNPLLSFFMHNLGAYKVDRRLRFDLYKDCLKAYSCVLLERGYHSLFFPGGTRSRSGAVEAKLKLGLAGTGVESYVRTLLAGTERRVYFVPATINYLITLEAETLIADYLSEAGKARYIIEDDESTRLGRVIAFVRKAFTMRGSVVIRFGDALDPFGNRVDAEGRSLDGRGRAIDTSSFVRDVAGEVVSNPDRDAQYTRELAQALVTAYRANTVVSSTNLVAAACFEHLRSLAPGADLFTVLRLRDQTIPRDDLARSVLAKRDALKALEARGEVVLSDQVRDTSGGDIVAQAMSAFFGFHTNPVIEAQEDGIALRDPKLLLYYQNRLIRHGLAFDPETRGRAGAAGGAT
ncbi:MAG: 1-acyl-sn-glycerol-3-phosphate acyltransferase [Deltaproteobacteria bacterium]|nr:1-acyl-sn-glycerol-3-phosphate acyltransferase [Deltaproteobacteria bacterium]